MLTVINKVLVFILMFSICVVVKYGFEFAIAFRKGVKMETDKWDGIKFASALSYIFTIIFTGLFQDMEITERITKIKDYFLKFNIDEGATIPDAKFLKEQYGVVTGAAQYGSIIFATELQSGFNKLFDAVEYTIIFNKEAQERLALLNAKILELKKLFATEPLDSLKKLKFELGKKRKSSQGKNNVTAEPTVEEVKEIVKPKIQETEEETGDSLLSAAKEIIAENKTE